jgi:hypothetical protein
MTQAEEKNSNILEKTFGMDVTANMSLDVSNLSMISMKQLDNIIQPS